MSRLRPLLALGGFLLWFSYPFAFTAGIIARHDYRCAGREFTGAWDGCFQDGLPIDFLAYPLTLLLLYPFARFLFVALAPPGKASSGFWRLARGASGEAYFPVVQVLALVGISWALLHVLPFPLVRVFFGFFAYWAAWILWFGSVIWLSWPRSRTE